VERPSGGVQGMEADEGAVSEEEPEGQGGEEFVQVAEEVQAWWSELDPGSLGEAERGVRRGMGEGVLPLPGDRWLGWSGWQPGWWRCQGRGPVGRDPGGREAVQADPRQVPEEQRRRCGRDEAVQVAEAQHGTGQSILLFYLGKRIIASTTPLRTDTQLSCPFEARKIGARQRTSTAKAK